MAAPEDKNALEQLWNDQVMSANPDWRSFRSTHRKYVSPGNSQVVWDLVGGVAVIHRTLRMVDFELTAKRGLAVTGTSNLGEAFIIRHTPVEIVAGVFMWVPAFCDFRYVPPVFSDLSSGRRLTVPMCVKTALNPETTLVEGTRYVSDLRDFRKNWPNSL